MFLLFDFINFKFYVKGRGHLGRYCHTDDKHKNFCNGAASKAVKGIQYGRGGAGTEDTR